MNMSSSPRAPRRWLGLRTAVIVYLSIVVAGLGGAAAHALWNLDGKVVSTVTAGSWVSKVLDAGTVKCTREDKTVSGENYSNLTLSWDEIGAEKYTVSTNDNSGTVVETVSKPPVTLRLLRNNFTANTTYEVTITSHTSGVDDTSATVDAEMTKKGNPGEALVACKPSTKND